MNVIRMSKEGKKKSILSRILNILWWIIIGIIIIILLILLIRGIGKAINNKTPDGGINENMYININNSSQWISIYGKDINNPVMLYLHSGPGSSSSFMDYKVHRKWSDIFTIVTWDQRDVGLSAKNNEDQKDVPYTKELFISDGLEVTKYILNYLHKDKIVLLGYSWGTILGTNIVLEHPEYYQYYIGTGQVIDARENEKSLIEAAKEWSKGDKEGEELVAKLDLNLSTTEAAKDRIEVLKRYHYDALAEKPDYNVPSAAFFNPYYSLSDLYKLLFSRSNTSPKYIDFISSTKFNEFSLLNRTEYQIPYYNINGDHDYQANCFQAEEYFNNVKAPRKKYYKMNDMNHGLLFVHSDEFSKYIHEIASLK